MTIENHLEIEKKEGRDFDLSSVSYLHRFDVKRKTRADKRFFNLASPRDGFPPDEADGIPDRSCPDPDELPRPDDDPDNPSMLKNYKFVIKRSNSNCYRHM